jgi:orotate phosphoribosyltransferase-like protein
VDKIDELLMYVQKTNPGMTREKLIDELNKSDYAAKSLLFTSENFRKNFQSPLP